MASHQHKKFVRSKEPPKSLRIQSCDLGILADYRFLDAEQILALHPGSLRNTQVWLSLLYHSGYVERPAAQKLFARSGKHFIYALGNKGAELLSRERPRRHGILPAVFLERIGDRGRTLI